MSLMDVTGFSGGSEAHPARRTASSAIRAAARAARAAMGGLPHGLDQMRERMQLLAHEADQKVVVVDVEAMADETDIVREVGVAVRAADGAVLAEDGPLVLR